MIVIIVALSYVPGVADHETAFAATQPSSGRTSDAKGDIVLLTTELGRDDKTKAEFARCVSRLIEMQSAQYLAAAHRDSANAPATA